MMAQATSQAPAHKAPTLPAKTTTAAKKPVATRPATLPMTEQQKTIYSLGLSIYKSLGQFDLSPAELDLVKKGMTDAAANKPAVELQTYGPKIGDLQKERSAHVAEREKTASTAYLAKAAALPGVVKTDSGLIYKELTPGTGATPKATDNVKVNYKGSLVDGSVFDSSYDRKAPVDFNLNQVIPCWTEGVQKMKVGGKAQLVCPSNIAYGDQGHPPVIPGGATLVFEVELVAINGTK